jgi:hypothetical protein
MASIREAAIITAYTGIALGSFRAFHEYAESILDRPILTHEFGLQATWDELREASRADFVHIIVI